MDRLPAHRRSARAARDERAGRAAVNAGRRAPVGILLLLVVSWVTFFAFERDEFATDHPLYYHIPDLTQNAPAVFLNLLVTPLVNTQPDQILLVTGLFVLFGIAVERRFGTWPMIGIFWIASSLAAVLGGALLHVLYPLFPDMAVDRNLPRLGADLLARHFRRLYFRVPLYRLRYRVSLRPMAPSPWTMISIRCRAKRW